MNMRKLTAWPQILHFRSRADGAVEVRTVREYHTIDRAADDSPLVSPSRPFMFSFSVPEKTPPRFCKNCPSFHRKRRSLAAGQGSGGGGTGTSTCGSWSDHRCLRNTETRVTAIADAGVWHLVWCDCRHVMWVIRL